MKKRFVFGTALAAALMGWAMPVRILPLGDSITYGQGWDPHGGYRAVLREKLVQAGYAVDYVGTQAGNPGTLTASGDVQHEGHPGWNVAGITGALPQWFAQIAAPNVILLKIGTNNCNGDHAQVMAQLRTLLDDLRRYQPSAHVVCGTLVTFLNGTEVGGNDAWVREHNELLKVEVASRQAMGERVSLADLYAVVSPATGMNDDRHPNEEGYRAMAQVWFDAIRAIYPDASEAGEDPALAAIACTLDAAQTDTVKFMFNDTLADDAADLRHFAFGEGFTPVSATLGADRQSVIVRGAGTPRPGAACTVTVEGLANAAHTRRLPGTTFTFRHLPVGARNYVPEAGRYRKVYGYTVPNAAGYFDAPPAYDFDDHANVGAFTRVAYYVELQRKDEELKYLWVSMDKFTDDVARLAIPTVHTLPEPQAILQTYVSNLKVWSNVDTVTPGEKARGNIEFWPYNYGGAPVLGIPGAGGNYDVDDNCVFGGKFGSMQIHDTDAAVPLFCFNNWGGLGGNCDLGIGPNLAGNLDWTQTGSAVNWTQRRVLEIYVLEDTEPVPGPKLVSAALVAGRTGVTLVFDTPVLADETLARRISLSSGERVLAVRRSATDARVVVVETDPIAMTGQDITLTVTDAYSDTPSHSGATSTAVVANKVAIAHPVPEAVLGRVPDAAGYEHLFTIDIPANMKVNDGGGKDMVVNEANYAAYHVVNNAAALQAAGLVFGRVAYMLELEDNAGNVSWAWTAFDAFSQDFADLDMPTRGHVNGRFVSHLDVASNVGGIVTGTGLSTGVIEFSPFDYGGANSRGVPNGDGGRYDFADNLYVDVNAYSCMSVANYAAELPDRTGQMIWAMSKFNGNGLGLGIGNAPNEHIDYTFTANAGQYARRTLYVMVMPDPGADLSEDYVPVRAVASADGTRVAVSFAAPVRDTALQARYFSVGGSDVSRVEKSARDPRDVILTLAQPLAPNTQSEVSTLFPKSANRTMPVYGRRDLPAALVDGVDELGDYVLLNDLTVPYNCSIAQNGADYRTDESRFGFDRAIERVAYALELDDSAQEGGSYRWAWVSMDPFTTDPALLGVPSVTRGNHFQCYVDNIRVRAGSSTGVSPIATGEWDRGNIEFTPSNYASGNALGIPDATDAFDWGDQLYGNGASAGHGCMQIHNFQARDMVLGFSRLGGGQVPGLMIGLARNADGTVADDGTWTSTRHLMTTHELRVFVKLAPAPEVFPPELGTRGLGPEFLVQPPAETRLLLRPGEGAQRVTLNTYAPGATRYQWWCDGEQLVGETAPVITVSVADAATRRYAVVAYLDDANYTASALALVTGVPLPLVLLVR